MPAVDGQQRGELADDLVRLAKDLHERLGDAATVTHEVDEPSTWRMTPKNANAAGAWWTVLGDELVIEVLSNGPGGRWEVEAAPAGMQFLREHLEAVVAGRVTEVSAKRGSRVTVTHSDGTEHTETGLHQLIGLVNLGRRSTQSVQQFEPYA